MHSRIFVLNADPELPISTTEDELYDNLHNWYCNGADIVCEESEDSRQESLQWLRKTYQGLIEDSTPDSITFAEDASERFFPGTV